MSAQRNLGFERKMVFVTRAETSRGVDLHICDNGVRLELPLRAFDPVGDAVKIVDALLELPVETRRAFYTLLTQEMYDGFNAAPNNAPVRATPPMAQSARRRRR